MNRILLFLPLVLCAAAGAAETDLRIGVLGLDTSHTVSFAELLNDPANPNPVPGARIVAAWKGGSADVEASATRVEGFAAEMQKPTE